MIKIHGTEGIIIDGVAIKADPDEINKLAGLSTTKEELEKLSGLSTTKEELEKLSKLKSTTEELDLLAGGATIGAFSFSDGDGIIFNDAGTMRMTKVYNLAAYMRTKIAGAPAGSVIYHTFKTAPTGFIKANGAAISRSDYSVLFSAIGITFGVGNGFTTFNVPDLRGEFIRGWDDGKGTDAGRAFGSSQADEVKNHEHRMFRANTAGTADTNQNDLYRGFRSNDYGTSSVANSGRSGPMFSGGGGETRSRNVALLACIKI